MFCSLQPETHIHTLSHPFTPFFISTPADEAFTYKHHVKAMTQRNRLTEIFGGTPGPRLALAQGEAALSAQETPHPCPACGRARSSQPPFTPDLEVDAAKECPRTPLCCSSPELAASKSLYPARRKEVYLKGHIYRLSGPVPPPVLNQTTSGLQARRGRPEESVRKSGSPSWVRWSSLSLSLSPNPMAEQRSENWDTLTWS